MESFPGRALRSALSALDVTLASWTSEHLREAADECRRRAGALRGELDIGSGSHAGGMRRVNALEGAAALCELEASELEVP